MLSKLIRLIQLIKEEGMHDYRKLIVWQKGMEFVKLIYRLTRLFPKEEIYGLTSQIRRATVSVVGNIVEGRGKPTDKDFLRFLYIARGSINEVECYIELSKELGFINLEQYECIYKKCREVGFLLYKLIKSLE